MKKYYVTYRTKTAVPTSTGIPKFMKVSRAIECPDHDSMISCAHDLNSLAGVSYLRVNTCGKLKKGVTVHSYDDYKNGHFGV